MKQWAQWMIKNARLAHLYGRPHRAFYATPKFIGKFRRLDGFAPRDYIHNLNYDKVLDLERRTPREKSYVAYIDQNLPVDHQVQVDGEAMLSEEVFWDRMQKLFERITSRTAVDEVVVCAHPNRSQKSIERLSSFCCVVQFETEKKIRDCAFVIAHATTALDFAVIFEKPTCFIAMPEMKRNRQFRTMIYSYAEKLGREVNVLKDGVPDLDIGLDESAYSSFKRNFIKTPGTPDLNSWEYITSALNPS